MRKGVLPYRCGSVFDGKSVHLVAKFKGMFADGSDAIWNGDVIQNTAIIKGIIADLRNFFYLMKAL